MADRITINFTANTRDVERGAERISDSLSEVEDSLDDVGTEGQRSLEKATEATDDLGESADATGGKVGAIGGIAKDALEGDLSGAASAGAEALSALGPAGVAAGIIAVGGIEIIKGVVEGIGEATEADQAKAAEWAQAYIDAGSKILSAAQTVASSNAIITDPEQYEKAQENAKNWGVSVGLAVLAMAGNTDALAEATASLDARGDVATANAAAAEKASRDLTRAEIDYLASVATGRSALLEQTASMNLGAAQADTYSESLRLLAENTAGATSKVDEFGDTIYSLPDGTVVYIDAETGQATSDTDAIANKIYSLPDKTITVNVSGLVEAQTAIDAFLIKPATKNILLKPTTPTGVPVP